jgi:hypothetical protein
MNRNEQQIFVSYAHIDNARFRQDQDGWVDYFHSALEVELKQSIGEGFKFWRDKRDLCPNDFFDNRILAAVERSELFVAVLSPVYLKREYCLKELGHFFSPRDGCDPDTVAARIVKVLRRPLQRGEIDDSLPDPLKGRVGFKFFEHDRETDSEIHYWDGFGAIVRPQYWDVLRQVARAITRHLSQEPPKAVRCTAGADGPVVYLAEPSADLIDAHRMVRGELQAVLDARIEPGDQLPNLADEAIATIDAALGKAQFSIHLLGNTAGYVPDGDQSKAIVELQLERAALRAAGDPSFRRLIWAAPGLKPTQERQNELVSRLGRGDGLLETDEFISETLEHFKNFALESLRRTKAGAKAGMRSAGKPVLYLVCRREEEEEALRAREFFFERGIEVWLPDFEICEDERDSICAEYALRADAVLVHYATGSEGWVRQALLKMSDWRALGRAAAFRTVAVLLAGEPSLRKTTFRSQHADLVLNAMLTPLGEALVGLAERLQKG